MRELGRVTYGYFNRAGFRLDVEIVAYPEIYRVGVLLNGCLSCHSRRPTLASSLRWGFARCDALLNLFGLGPVQLSFGSALRAVQRRLVA
ncbi:MAG: hypothetical protein HY331_17235 [Chloroflexi bacterium]|nr:hypothetical protein [Chloroflexota bacterium]